MRVTNNGIQKKVNISYDSMEELLNRQEHITNTLQNSLDRFNNEQFIEDTNIFLNNKNQYILSFTLGIKE